jgi:hypothetical protein
LTAEILLIALQLISEINLKTHISIWRVISWKKEHDIVQ